MAKGDLFLIGVVLLQTGAVVSYLLDRDWRQAFVWGGVVVSNAAYLTLVRS